MMTNAWIIVLINFLAKIMFVNHASILARIVLSHNVFHAENLLYFLKTNVQKRLLLKILDVKNALNFVFIALKNNVLSVIHSISY